MVVWPLIRVSAQAGNQVLPAGLFRKGVTTMPRLQSFVLLATLATAPFVYGQTGPSGGPTTGGAGAVNTVAAVTNPGAGQAFTPDRMAAYLRGLGYRVEPRTVNGAIIHKVSMQKDGWSYSLDIEFSTNQQLFVLAMPLGNPNTQMSANQLMELLKTSFRVHPNHFNIREVDGKLQLYLDGPWYGSNMTDAAFQSTLDRFLKDVRATHPAWDSSRWPVAGQAVAAGGVNGVAPVTVANSPSPVNPATASGPALAVAQGLANTTWVGNEVLKDFGRLEFRFQEGGKAIMVDTAGPHPGTYSLQGNTVTLAFYDGQVIYSGILNGQTIAGSAYNTKNAQNTWKFSVSR
jgi:hypothetical protein